MLIIVCIHYNVIANSCMQWCIIIILCIIRAIHSFCWLHWFLHWPHLCTCPYPHTHTHTHTYTYTCISRAITDTRYSIQYPWRCSASVWFGWCWLLPSDSRLQARWSRSSVLQETTSQSVLYRLPYRKSISLMEHCCFCFVAGGRTRSTGSSSEVVSQR